MRLFLLFTLPLMLALACDAAAPTPVTFREEVGVIAIIELDQLADALASCDSGPQPATVWLSTIGPELPEGQAFTLQIDAIAPPDYLTCLGKALETLNTTPPEAP